MPVQAAGRTIRLARDPGSQIDEPAKLATIEQSSKRSGPWSPCDVGASYAATGLGQHPARTAPPGSIEPFSRDRTRLCDPARDRNYSRRLVSTDPAPGGSHFNRRGWVTIQALPTHLTSGGCREQLGALPETLVWDREAAIAGHSKPTEEFARVCGLFRSGWDILDAGDPQAKGVLARSTRSCARIRPWRRFANPIDFQHSWTPGLRRRTKPVHRTTRAVPAERLAGERLRVRPLPDRCRGHGSDRLWAASGSGCERQPAGECPNGDKTEPCGRVV